MRHVLLPVLLTMQHTVMMINLYWVEGGGSTQDKNVKNALTFLSIVLGGVWRRCWMMDVKYARQY